MDEDVVYTADEAEPEEQEETQEEQEEPGEPEAEQPEEAPDPLAEFKASLEDQKKENERLQKEVNRLGYALRTASKTEKKSDEPQFTEAQLLQILKQHQDEPEVALQVMKEIAKQSAKGIEASTEKKAEIQQTRGQIETYIGSVFPDWKSEESPIRAGIEKAKSMYHLEDHPLGDELALGMIEFQRIPAIIKAEVERVQKDALGKSAEQKRKQSIAAGKPTPSTGKKGAGESPLSTTELETAKKLGINPQKYAKFLKGARTGSITAD
jgi:hypothetical protein